MFSHLQLTLKVSFSEQNAPAMAERRGPLCTVVGLSGSSGGACSYYFCFAILSSSQEILFPPLPGSVLWALRKVASHGCCHLSSYAWLLSWPALRDEVKTLSFVKQWPLEPCSNWSGFACTTHLATFWGHF